MNPRALVKAAEQVIRQNSPAILAGLGATGTVVTAYLAHQAGYNAAYKMDKTGSKKDKVRQMWKSYIPTVIAGTVTAGCIIGAVKIGNRRTAAITAAYSLSEKAFQEYRDKVTEKMGERKEQQVRDEIAQERAVAGTPPREIVLMGAGDVLCYDLQTDRPFLGTMEGLKKAQNDVNFRILKDGYAYLSDFYSMIGVYLPKESQYGYNMGWNKENGAMELTFSTILVDETRPCLAFKYNYLQPL